MVKGFLLSTALVVAWIVAQIVVVHTRQPRGIFNLMTSLFVPTVPVWVVLYLWTPPDLYILPEGLSRTSPGLALANGLLVHLLLYCTWIEAYYYLDRPVTLRLLVELVKAPHGVLTLSQIQHVYGLGTMIGGRLASMQDNGYLRVDGNGCYILTTKGRLFATAIGLIRKVLGVPYYFQAATVDPWSG